MRYLLWHKTDLFTYHQFKRFVHDEEVGFKDLF